LPYYNTMWRGLLSQFFDLLVPPRRSDLVVRALSLEELQSLYTAEGLPYHDESVRALVWELKYYANPRAAQLCGAFLAEELLALAADELGRPLLVPVPMHPARRRERGHNQTEVLCEAILKALGASNFTPVEYAPHALARTRDTAQQQGLERGARLQNVKGSMQAAPALVRGRVCVVVDDVATTGATLAEATRALKAAGARRVHTVALARS